MTIRTSITRSLGEIDTIEYDSLFERCGSPLFYDRRFLLAAEQSPLLPTHGSFYITIRRNERIVGFLPAYLQDIGVVDPLGLLAASAKISNVGGNSRGLFSHIMHCADSAILTALDDSEIYAAAFAALGDIARQEGARYFGLLNVQDGPVLREAARHDLNVNYMVDRYCVDLSRHDGFDAFVQALPADGRHEMARQLRKFEQSGARAHILAPPFGDKLEQLSELCQLTTSRNGTPRYWPAGPLARFAHICGDLVRLSVVEVGQDLVSGFICLEEPHTFHIWSAGMVYDRTEFSPYTLGVAAAYRHAFERGMRRVECGRLNAKIKTRLGLHPLRLYALTSRDLLSESPWRPSSAPTAQDAFAHGLDGEARFSDHPAFGDWYRSISWNQRDFGRTPACIVRASSERDIVRTIAFAKTRGQRISVRGGGHSYCGSFLQAHSILLDLSRLQEIEIDAQNGRAMVQPGVTSQRLSKALAAHGLAFPTGHGADVGLGGFLLGGGLGINCSQWGGMSVFNVEALDVVTADGRSLHISAADHPDLFWAARGAGPASFFVATRFYLKCRPAPGAILSSTYIVGIDKLDRLVREIELAQPAANLQVMIAVVPKIGGSAGTRDRTVLLGMLAFDETAALARQLRTSFQSRLGIELQAVEEDQPAGFESLYRQTDGMLTCKRYRVDNILTDRAQEAVPILRRHLKTLPSPATAVLFAWRGHPAYPDAAFSAQGSFFVSTYAQWNDANDDDINRRWLNGLYDDLQPVSSGAYINEFDLEHRADQVARCFSAENWGRLQELRQRFDASRLFVTVDSLPVSNVD